MNFGMVSWSLLGAQGRYNLATWVAAIMSFCVTIPLSAYFCMYLKYTPDALVGAVIIGYSTTGTVLGYLLLRSDWEHISMTIRGHNEAGIIDDDGDPHEDDLSVSSSSSSSPFG